MIEWLVAAAVLLVFLALLPRMLRRAKPATRKGGGSMMIAIGIAFSMIFDAKASESIELIARKKDIGDGEDESGEKP